MWTCSCGRDNTDTATCCAVCGSPPDYVQRLRARESLRRAAVAERPARHRSPPRSGWLVRHLTAINTIAAHEIWGGIIGTLLAGRMLAAVLGSSAPPPHQLVELSFAAGFLVLAVTLLASGLLLLQGKRIGYTLSHVMQLTQLLGVSSRYLTYLVALPFLCLVELSVGPDGFGVHFHLDLAGYMQLYVQDAAAAPWRLGIAPLAALMWTKLRFELRRTRGAPDAPGEPPANC